MSYTMTMDMPDSAVSFLTRNGTRSRAELGDIFVAFMVDRMGYVVDDTSSNDPVSRVIGCIKTDKSSNELVRELRGI